MDSSLVGSQMSSDASNEQSLVLQGVGYNEAFGSGDESEGFSHLSERETSAQSSTVMSRVMLKRVKR